jgi:hypothetical protein
MVEIASGAKNRNHGNFSGMRAAELISYRGLDGLEYAIAACQRLSWGAALVSVPAKSLSWTRGQPDVFRSSTIVARGFCASCGTPLYMREDGDSNFELAIGAFDNPSGAGPLAEQVGVESRVSWFNDMQLLPEQTTAETRTPQDLAKLKSLQHPDHDTEHWP